MNRPMRWTACLVAPVMAAVAAIGMVPAASAVTEPAAPSFTGYSDKSTLRIDGREIVATGELPVVDGTAPSGSGTTYYVDSVGGDDAADGTSTTTAWQTFANVNARQFAPGDRILLKAGSSWSAEGGAVAREAYDYTQWTNGAPTDVDGADPTALLAPGGSGTPDDPIVLSSYGTGAAPELNGRGVVNDTLQFTNQEHWDISNVEISNVTDGFDATTFEPGANQGQKPGEENPLTGDLRGVHVAAENAGTLRGYEIHDVFIRDVSGVTWSIGNTGLDRSKRTGGILFEGLKGDASTVSQFEDVSIRDSVVANTAFANVMFKQFSGMGENRYKDVDPGWGDRAVAKATNTAAITEDPDWRPHSGIEVSGNYLTNRDTAYGWNSLYLTSVQRATIEGNLIDGAGVSGIEMYYSDDILVQDNEVAEIETRVNAADSNGIDPDRGTSNILIQGNYVHDSGEGILLCGFGFSTAVVRYNVIQDVDKNYINPHGDSGANVIYNNLMYNTQVPAKNNTIGFFNSSGSNADFLLERNRHHVLNNVFVNTLASVSGSAFRSDFPGVAFARNVYWGPSVAAPAEDANAITGNPDLGGNPADAIANIVPASAASSVISSGAAVDLAQIVPGFDTFGDTGMTQVPLGGDFFGQPVGASPHAGPASYIPPAGMGVVSGRVLDEYGDPVPGASVSYGASTAEADASGRYSFETVAGSITLIASAAGYADGQPVPVSIASGETLAADVPLGATTATSGDLVGTVRSSITPVSDVTVTVTAADGTVTTTTSDVDGEFAIASIPAGEGYTVSAGKDGYVTAVVEDVTVRAARTQVLDLILIAERTEAVYAINENFDDETVGLFSETIDGALVAKPNSAVGSVSIEDDASRAGNKVLRIAKTSASSGSLAVHNVVEQNLTGVVTLEARLARTSTNGAPNQLAMYSFTESNWNAANPTASSNPSATFGFSNGKIMTHNVTGSSSVKNVADYAVGRWYTVRNVADLNTGTFDLYIDDMTTPVLADQPLRTLVDDLDFFEFFINGSNVGDLLVDYFRVNTGSPYDYGDASLGSVSATAAVGDIVLTPSADGSTYSGTVDSFADSVDVSAIASSPFAKVTVAGETVPGGQAVEVPLVDGPAEDSVLVTEIPVTVVAEDGSKVTYPVVISRPNPSQSTSLRDLAIVDHELTPEFSPGRKGVDQPYRVVEELDAGTASVTLRWELGWAGQRVQVDGEVLPAGATEATIELVDGENVVEVTTDSFPGDVGIYVVALVRASAEPSLPVEVSTSTRCIAGEVALIAHVTNNGAESASVRLSTEFGEWARTKVKPGKAVFHVFHTGLAILPAGSIVATIQSTIDGEGVSSVADTAYPTQGC